MPKYKNKNLHGLLVVDKPIGITSMDVVRHVRKAGGFCKTGHGGTLDPLATGVLVCALGKGTKVVNQIMDKTKTYETVIDLSAFSTTDDAEGEKTEVEPKEFPARESVDSVLSNLTGEIEQMPPQFSALKVDGKPAYKLARKGKEVELESRVVRIDSIECKDYQWPMLSLKIVCGKGTYIRSLARQIGEALNTGGHLKELRRTAVGEYTIENATKLDEVPTPLLEEHLLPLPEEDKQK